MILKPPPQERAMKAHDVMLRAMAGELSWLQAADLMGVSPRSMRRWRERMERGGADGLLDRRCRPSPRRGAGAGSVVAPSAVQGALSGVQRAPLPRGPRPRTRLRVLLLVREAGAPGGGVDQATEAAGPSSASP